MGETTRLSAGTVVVSERGILDRLGLRTDYEPSEQWTDVGTTILRTIADGQRVWPARWVSVEVRHLSAFNALFMNRGTEWRLTIHRVVDEGIALEERARGEDNGPQARSEFVVLRWSGMLEDIWPTVVQIASQRLTVEAVDR